MQLPIPAFLYGCFSALCLLLAPLAFATARITGEKIFSVSLLISCIALFCTVIAAWTGEPGWQLQPVFADKGLALSFRCDFLSNVFLALLCLSSVSFSICSFWGSISPEVDPGKYWCAHFLFVFAAATVILSADAITFFISWALMSISSLFLGAGERHSLERRGQQQWIEEAAKRVYLCLTTIATVFLGSSFLWMQSLTNSCSFTSWKLDVDSPAAILILLAFCLEVGAGVILSRNWHAHDGRSRWLSVLMSGVIIEVAIYGLIRILLG